MSDADQTLPAATIFIYYLSPYTRNDLTCGDIRTNSSNETNHCSAGVEDLCLGGETKFHCFSSKDLLIMMTRLPSWVNCNSSSGCHRSSSYKSSSFCMSCQSASGFGIGFFTWDYGISRSVFDYNKCILVVLAGAFDRCPLGACTINPID